MGLSIGFVPTRINRHLLIAGLVVMAALLAGTASRSEAQGDTIPPTVTTVVPANATTGVSRTANIRATFSESMTQASITATTFQLRDQNNALVSATVSYNVSTRVATLNPAATLLAGTNYTATIRGGTTDPRVKDLSGNALAANFVWFFKTTGTDATAPAVTGFTPASGAAGVSPTTTVTATFSEAMTASTINGSTFRLTGPGGTQLAAAVAYTAATRTATLTPSSSLASATTYAATVLGGASGVKDLASNALVANVAWSFTTGGTDTTPPTISSFTPPSGATGIAITTTVTAIFSEAMTPSSITNSNVTLIGPGSSPVVAAVAYNATTNVATLTSSSPLAASTAYTATVFGGASGVKDLAGNALVSNVTWSFTTAGATSCTPNPIVCENQNPGNPASEWDVTGAGDPNIQGFATDISVNKGGTVRFKIDTPAVAYRLDIYRMGYYAGTGARKIVTVRPTIQLPQNQPNCLTDASTGLVDCGNWAASVNWTVPADAVSGIYFAKAVREDTSSGGSHIVFVVRDDASQADILFQTSDTTWQAYNQYGGNSLYVGGPGTNPGRAYKVSYNRPFTTRGTGPEDWLFNSEYPMVRWLESNGYHVSYSTGVDSDRFVAGLLQHKIFMSVGHDEYWSGAQRANVEAARNAGIHLAFFSGNESFWKTRWENSIDSSSTPYRTLVSYKETHANAKIDPLPNVWTGTWRDPRFSPPADGGRPENAMTGTIFKVNSGTTAITVPEPLGKLRFWRNTTVAALPPGQTATLAANTLGYEWDEEPNNGFRPPGLFQLSSTTAPSVQVLLDFGSTYGSGTANHSLALYRHASGALVFGAGTIQWSWGLDGEHDRGGSTPDQRMRQATVNLLADMGVQPATLQAGLVSAAASFDVTAPTSTITSPSPGASVQVGQGMTITGTASDGGGIVAAVEVSTDGGATWRRANGSTAWTFSWTPTATGTVTLKSRAVDDSANLETPAAGVTVNVGARACPCSIWSPSTTPTLAADPDTAAIEVGVKFRADVDGTISGIRFYQSSANTGTHVGNLWTSTGQLLATVTFAGETGSGWQQANFAGPVSILANTIYVASYHTNVGRYANDEGYFATAGVDNAPLHALATTVSPNGVFQYGPGGFPTNTFNATNYYVDVVFTPSGPPPPDVTPPTVTAFTPGGGSSGVSTATAPTVTFSEAMDATTINSNTLQLRDPSNALVSASVAYNASTSIATLTPASPLAASTTYTATVRGGSVDPRVKDLAGNALASALTWSFTTAATSSSGCPCTIWAPTTTPAVASANDSQAVELGVKFRSDLAGFITGVRFYKGPANTGTHVGNLWTSAGQLLGSVTFTGESQSGWQLANFATPVQIAANTTYVASYHTNAGQYAVDSLYFASAGADRPPLHALSNLTSPNGVYQYGPGGFPNQSFNSSNYWVDVVFTPTGTPPADTTPPTVAQVSPSSGAAGVSPSTNVTVAFSEAMDQTTISTTTIELRTAGNTLVPATVTYDLGRLTATLRPVSPLAASANYTLTVRGGTTDPRVKDVAGNALAANFSSSFSTATATAPPPLGQGPGGPILVITSPQNKFSTYYAEILNAEGLNLYFVSDISTVDASLLAGYDVVILSEMALTPAQVTMLSNWVNSGGNLIAMRPDKQLSPLLGLADAGTTLSNAYLLVNTSAPPGVGIVGQTIQFHGTADRYTLSGATAVATLYSSASAATPSPAVTLRSVGALGGQAAAFTYDLARSVVYTRQGNVPWAAQERDGSSPIRSDDQFFGAAAGDVQPDWIDLNKVAIPQVDEQQRLLANLILSMNADRKPLPRFWYLPRDLKAAVVMTGDDHGNGGTTGRFDQYTAASPPGCSVDDWQCVRSTSYIYVGSVASDSVASAYNAQGFEIGLHVLTGCSDWTPSSLASFYDDQLASFHATYPSLPLPTTNRTHCIAWSDWATQPKIEFGRNIGLDTNYYYWPPSWVADRPGFFTGSGMPMRFADVDGTLIDVYQATSQMTDESGQSFPFTIDTLLNRALGTEGYYGVFTANMHTDFVNSAGSGAIVASAQARGVPIVSARQMLQWLDGRDRSSFGSLTWDGTTLRFQIDVGPGANGLQAMIPATSAAGTLTSLTREGLPTAFTLKVIKGVQYATFPAGPGNYAAAYAP